MVAEIIDLMLNASLVFAMLLAPSLLVVAHWYRRSMGKPIFSWPKPEMVLLTIVFFILALMLFIVGVSCFFTYFGYLDPVKLPMFNIRQFFNLGLACFLAIGGLTMVYFCMRKILVQMVVENGLLLQRGLFPLRNSLRMLEWNQIVDYYIVPDYPNLTVTFIVAGDNMSFDRHSIKVPIYLKDDFQTFVDKQLYAAKSFESNSEISSSRYFSEN
jgi:hypothetical protein